MCNQRGYGKEDGRGASIGSREKSSNHPDVLVLGPQLVMVGTSQVGLVPRPSSIWSSALLSIGWVGYRGQGLRFEWKESN